MSEQNITNDQLRIITRVSKDAARKFNIVYFGPEDIEQEARYMCLEAFPRWDEIRSLRGFLWTHVCNRMITLIRDKTQTQKAGKGIATASIDYEPIDLKQRTIEDKSEQSREIIKLMKIISREYRNIMRRIMYGCRQVGGRKIRLINFLSEISPEYALMIGETILLQENLINES